MKTVRPNVFETNSSSTHEICLCTEADYEKFKKGDMLWVCSSLVPFDTIYERFKNELQNAEPGTYQHEMFVERFNSIIPSPEQFRKVIESNETIQYDDDPRSGFRNDDDYYAAGIMNWLYDSEVRGVNNFSHQHGDWYESFERRLNGVVAFGYFG